MKNLLLLLFAQGACRGSYCKVRVNGKKQRKSTCEAVLGKKLHRIFVRLEKMVSVFFIFPTTSVRIDDF